MLNQATLPADFDPLWEALGIKRPQPKQEPKTC